MNNIHRRTGISRRLCLTALATPMFSLPVFAQSSDIVIGQSFPLSGAFAPVAKALLEGQQMAFDEVNRQGGIFGRRIALTVLDDGFDPKRTLENVHTLVGKNQAVALMGLVGTAQVAAVLPYIAEKHVPLISVYSGSPGLRGKPNPYFFTTQASYIDELKKIVSNLMATMATRIALVYQNNEFGNQLRPLAEKIIVAKGGTVAGVRPLEVNGADAQAVAQSLGAENPRAVILIAAGPAVVRYVKASRTALGVPIYTFSLSVGTSTLVALGEDARGLAVARSTPYPWRPTTALTRDFNSASARHKMPVDYDHFAGYINARVMIEALRGAGKKLSSEAVAHALEKMARLDLGGYVFNFSPDNHHGSDFVEIVVVGPRGQFMR